MPYKTTMPKSNWHDLAETAEAMRIRYGGNAIAAVATPGSWEDQAIALASPSCSICAGRGLVWGHPIIVRTGLCWNPCRCAMRAVFRACFNRYRECAEPGGATGHRYHDGVLCAHEQFGPTRYGRPREEFCADFCLITGRTLTKRDLALFRLFFLCGLPWYECCRMLGIERGVVFHRVYKIESQLGRAFHDTTPYPLWPLHEYFQSWPMAESVNHYMKIAQ